MSQVFWVILISFILISCGPDGSGSIGGGGGLEVAAGGGSVIENPQQSHLRFRMGRISSRKKDKISRSFEFCVEKVAFEEKGKDGIWDQYELVLNSYERYSLDQNRARTIGATDFLFETGMVRKFEMKLAPTCMQQHISALLSRVIAPSEVPGSSKGRGDRGRGLDSGFGNYQIDTSKEFWVPYSGRVNFAPGSNYIVQFGAAWVARVMSKVVRNESDLEELLGSVRGKKPRVVEEGTE